MDDLEELYMRGEPVIAILNRIKKVTPCFGNLPVSNDPATDSSIANVMRRLLAKIEILHRDDPQIKQCNKKLNELEEWAIKIFYEWGAKGHYCAMGYSSIDNSDVIVIPPRQWNFLEMDFKRGACSFENTRYFGLRFLAAEIIIDLPPNLQELLEPKTKPTQIENISTEINVDTAATRNKTTRKKSKKEEVVEMMEKITPYLMEKYQNPANISTTYLKAEDAKVKECADFYTRNDCIIRNYLVSLGFQPGKEGKSLKRTPKRS